jgi:prepilin-type N-terminal cleavage/methylation domain-containing protein
MKNSCPVISNQYSVTSDNLHPHRPLTANHRLLATDHWLLTTGHSPLSRARAFTLIELLVVIAVISLLAAMIFPITGAVTRNRIRARARTEMEKVVTAIEVYKSKLGHYPPDNPDNPSVNQLYYELLGTTNNGAMFITLDGSSQIKISDLSVVFGNKVTGFVNCNKGNAGDEGRSAARCLPDVRSGQFLSVTNLVPGTPMYAALGTAANGPLMLGSPTIPGAKINPWRYNSSNPTNNPNSYDLWVDVLVSGKTNRISNWSKDVITVSKP